MPTRTLAGAAKNARDRRVLIDEAREVAFKHRDALSLATAEALLIRAYVKSSRRQRRKLDAEGRALLTGATP